MCVFIYVCIYLSIFFCLYIYLFLFPLARSRYTPDEARSLKAHGELPETAKINETDIFDDDGQNGVEFLDDESDEEAQEEMNNARRLDIEDVSYKYIIYMCI